MELFELENLLGLRGILLALWVVLFIVAILLIISGIKAENKRTKIILIIFGAILIFSSVFLFFFTFFFGYNS